MVGRSPNTSSTGSSAGCSRASTRTSLIDTRDGRGDVGPGGGHAAHGLKHVFGGDNRVEGEQHHQRHDHVTDTDQLGPIDGQVDVHVAQIGGGPLPQGLVDQPIGGRGIAAEHQEVDQAVLERRVALFDRPRGVGRVDAAQERRHEVGGHIVRGTQQEPEQRDEPAQPAQVP